MYRTRPGELYCSAVVIDGPVSRYHGRVVSRLLSHLVKPLAADLFTVLGYDSMTQLAQLPLLDYPRTGEVFHQQLSPEATMALVKNMAFSTDSGDLERSLNVTNVHGRTLRNIMDKEQVLQLLEPGLDLYDYVLHLRVDTYLLASPPPLSQFEGMYEARGEVLWVPFGEDWSGINDKTAVLRGRGAVEVWFSRFRALITGEVLTWLPAVMRGSWCDLFRDRSQCKDSGVDGEHFNGVIPEQLMLGQLLSRGVRYGRFLGTGALFGSEGINMWGRGETVVPEFRYKWEYLMNSQIAELANRYQQDWRPARVGHIDPCFDSDEEKALCCGGGPWDFEAVTKCKLDGMFFSWDSCCRGPGSLQLAPHIPGAGEYYVQWTVSGFGIRVVQ